MCINITGKKENNLTWPITQNLTVERIDLTY